MTTSIGSAPPAISVKSTSIAAKIGSTAAKALDKPGISNFLTSTGSVKWASRTVVISNVLKDAVGCVLYTKQSLENKKIPEDKRKFVAMLDLANGILMVTFQFTFGWLMSSEAFQNKFNKLAFGKIFDHGDLNQQHQKQIFDRLKQLNQPLSSCTDEVLDRHYGELFTKLGVSSEIKLDFYKHHRYINNAGTFYNKPQRDKELASLFENVFVKYKPLSATQKKLYDFLENHRPTLEEMFGKFKLGQNKKLDPKTFVEAIESVNKGCTSGIKFVITIVASTIIAKRAIVPFLSTPIATWLEKKFMNKQVKEGKPVIEKLNYPGYPGGRPEGNMKPVKGIDFDSIAPNLSRKIKTQNNAGVSK